ncbi:hypothetical protein IGI04_018265 [Brassica rapa subsp. trilocularis]|uniref:Homeobox domain-containing protein n=1 Tax=Brassica rapa subsp. trilocularis TaxID=1813537 RepID=A0ABQ7MCF1_BRACM|nr:hypothetical protein IGI04_018265 [Brassica rapa subsp. trilocularis]
MASSNRHWPSMFKSKPHHHQWQHDMNSPLLPSPASHRSSPFSEYGQVGDANVFYWFQNRKSRSKHKLRLLHNHSKHSLPPPQPQPQPQPLSSASSSSSSSSSSSKSTKLPKTKNKKNTNNTNLSLGGSQMMGMFPPEASFLFPASTVGGFEGIPVSSQLGFFPGEMVEQPKQAPPTVEPCTGILLSEIMNGSAGYGTHNHQQLSEKEDEEMRMKMLQQPQICYAATSDQISSYNNNNNNMMLHVPPTASTTTTSNPLAIVPSTLDQLQVQAGARIRVFINEMEFEVSPGQFNVRDAFGEEVVLINSAGQPIVTDEYGVAIHPLQHGASYYLI